MKFKLWTPYLVKEAPTWIAFVAACFFIGINPVRQFFKGYWYGWFDMKYDWNYFWFLRGKK